MNIWRSKQIFLNSLQTSQRYKNGVSDVIINRSNTHLLNDEGGTCGLHEVRDSDNVHGPFGLHPDPANKQ